METKLLPPPTRQALLQRFQKYSKEGDNEFYFLQLVSSWKRCGYSILELTLLVKAPLEMWAKARSQEA